MIHLANALLAHGEGKEATDLHALLEKHSYSGPLVHSGAEALAEAKRNSPDILIIGPTLSDMRGVDLAIAIKNDPETCNTPVCLLVEERTPEVQEPALAAGVEEVLALPVYETSFFARVVPLIRIATMHWELKHRSDVAAQFGVTAPKSVSGPDEDAPPAVLVVGTDEDDLAMLRGELGKDTELTVVPGLFEAEDQITERNYDAAVMFVEGEISPYLDLCTHIRNNPRLFNLPVVLVASDEQMDQLDDRGDAYKKGASRVIDRPVDTSHLRVAVLTMVRRQRMRWTIRQAIDKASGPAVQDELTGLYSRTFFETYLAERLRIAQEQEKHLSLVFFRFPSMPGVRKQHGEEAGRLLLQQLGTWITKLVRVEDPTAFYGQDEFCVVLPDTPLDEAQFVMHRIAGVLAYTDFAVFDVYEVIRVWLQVGATDAKPGDTPASIVERARGNLY